MARNQKQQREASEFEERVVYINRVSKTVKGGRRMSLVALVVVGDGKGNVGVGMGKSAEVPLAISKASLDAKKNMFHVPVTDEGTIPHEVLGHFGAGRIVIKPAVEGTGVIAGGAVRPLFELAGIKNVLSKSLGTDNGLNIIKAAVEGLKELSSPEDVAARRGLTVSEMFVGKENYAWLTPSRSSRSAAPTAASRIRSGPSRPSASGRSTVFTSFPTTNLSAE